MFGREKAGRLVASVHRETMPLIRLMARIPRQRSIVVAAAVLLTVTLGGIYLYLFSDLPSPDALITRSSPDATKIYDRNGKLLYEILDSRAGRRTRVSLNELPASLKNAVIAVEDANYYAHPGVDAIGVARAIVQYLRAGYIVSGGSTITQQLARMVLLSHEEAETRTLTRKLREMLLALRLTQTYSKDQVFEMYLNETYFGNLAYGVEAASRTYFGKPARDLDLAESALLAGLIQSPTAYDPYVNFDAARARQRVGLDLMLKNGFITADEADLARSEELHFKAISARESIRAPHFVAYVRNLLEQQFGAEMVNGGGLHVVTTLDLNLQQRAEEIVKRHIDELQDKTRNESAPDYNLNDAALVAIEPDTGEILAMVGSADYFDESIDGAVNVALAHRQPGSAIKPITYATAFAQGLTPATVMSDVPTTFQTREGQPYAPQNYDRVSHGPISLRSALATSSNMIAVKVLERVGVDAMVETAKALGVTTFSESDRFGLALTLGGGEVKLLELTAAYAAFANQGRRVEPVAILQVSSPQSPVRERLETGNSVQAVSPQIAYLITNILSDDLARIPAFGEGSVLELTRPAAAKTGTTTDFRDNWTMGYTPDLAVGVWAGNADNSPMYRVSGITGAGPIWHDFMEEAHRGIPISAFQRPDGIREIEICDTSGLLPTPYCPRIRNELFIQGTEPTRADDSYHPLALDAATGLLWAEGCHGPRIQKVFRFFPPEASDWAHKQNFPEPPEVDCFGRATDDEGRTTEDNERAGNSEMSNVKRQTLVVISPANNSSYELSPQLPPELQQVEVAARVTSVIANGAAFTPRTSPLTPSPSPTGRGEFATVGSGMRSVTLMIDGVTLGTFTRVPYRALWQLTAGEHQAQAIGETLDGQRIESAVTRFTVR